MEATNCEVCGCRPGTIFSRGRWYCDGHCSPVRPENPGYWIAVDLDGTLAHYDHWRGPEHIGEPIMPMVERVRQWCREGKNVRIFTARVDGGLESEACQDVDNVRQHIEKWCMKHIGWKLPITNIKDFGMTEIWDDRAHRVEKNTGRQICDAPTVSLGRVKGMVREAMAAADCDTFTADIAEYVLKELVAIGVVREEPTNGR